MPETWFALSHEDQAEALEIAAASTGRPPHLLEKDNWVVWILSAIYQSKLADKLTFKGGTSLSKAYKIIDRFSEDIDLTYDIREIAPDLLQNGNPIPTSSSQAKKIADGVRDRLPDWIKNTVQPILATAIEREGIQATLSLAGKENEKLIIFPTAQPLVMRAERTFWEKATAAHVYSLQGRLRGERYSRHWYDLVAMAKSGHAQSAISDLQLGKDVAAHKSMFFAEKNASKVGIDYMTAVSGSIQLVPEGRALDALRMDYAAMLEDGLLPPSQASFAEIIEICFELQKKINHQSE